MLLLYSPLAFEIELREVEQCGQGLGVAGVGFNPRQPTSRASRPVLCLAGWTDGGWTGGVSSVMGHRGFPFQHPALHLAHTWYKYGWR